MKFFGRTMLAAAALAALFLVPRPGAAVDLTMYYPVAVGGPVTKIIDDMVARFEKENRGHQGDGGLCRQLHRHDDQGDDGHEGRPAAATVGAAIDRRLHADRRERDRADRRSRRDKAWFKEFYPAFMANGQIDGKTWSIPFQRSTIVLYWNKDAFKEAGSIPKKRPRAGTKWSRWPRSSSRRMHPATSPAGASKFRPPVMPTGCCRRSPSRTARS